MVSDQANPRRGLTIERCEFTSVENPPAKPVTAFEYYQQLRAYIEHEEGLINSRLSWSLTIDGLLLAADVLALQKSFDLVVELNAGGAHAALDWGAWFLWAFQIIVCFVGVAVSVLAYFSIIAAWDAIDHIDTIGHAGLLKIQNAPPESATGGAEIYLPSLISGGAPDAQGRGANYYHRLPICFAAAWFVLGLLSTSVLAYQLQFPVAKAASPKPPTVVVRDAVDALDRVRHGLPHTIHLVSVDRVELIGGASSSIDDRVWHIRGIFRDDERSARHRTYHADVFLRATDPRARAAIGP
jgi:hypothetical protein